MIESLVRKGVVKDLAGDYGHIIVDEYHHLSAQSFELVARRAKAKYVMGLSATVTRKDGHHPIIFMQCGPVRYRMICDDVLEALRDGRSPLLLTERKEYLKALADCLEPHVSNIVMPYGGRGIRETRAVASQLTEISEDEDRVLLATGRYLGEGFDDPRLDTLFLTLPFSCAEPSRSTSDDCIDCTQARRKSACTIMQT